jgi:5-methyltetrahydropteroyltriglutamate--homocysteine methyltransferase
MALATIPGYPRIGKRRELKRALEGYWSGKRTAADLEETASSIRRANWDAQTAAGLDLVPVNDFSLYDHVLASRTWSTSISSSPWRVAARATSRRGRWS